MHACMQVSHVLLQGTDIRYSLFAIRIRYYSRIAFWVILFVFYSREHANKLTRYLVYSNALTLF